MFKGENGTHTHTQTAWQWCESAELPYDEGKCDKIGFDEVS
jgi:hypothetical protein